MSQEDKKRFFKEICSNSARGANRYRGGEVVERQMVQELKQRYTRVALCCMLNLTEVHNHLNFSCLKLSSL
jgi:hypothetical protein